jgi:hypothetical protein
LALGTDVGLVDWIRVLPANSVLCSHGSVIARVMEILTRQGAEPDSPADWRKGSRWVLERAGEKVVRTVTVPTRPEFTVGNGR